MRFNPDNHAFYHILSICCIGIVGTLIYSNTLQGPFVFDDLTNIKDNPFIKITSLDSGKIYKAAFEGPSSARPVAKTSFALNYYFGKDKVYGYHLVNLVIHLLNGVLVYFLSLFVFRQLIDHGKAGNGHFHNLNVTLMALLSASIFVAHPIQVQSVTYLVQRMNSMATLFYFLSLLLYIQGRHAVSNRRKWLLWSICLLSWILALGSKQIAATLPVVIVLYEWYFFQNFNNVWIKRNIKYLIGLLLLLVLISILYLGGDPLHRILGDYHSREFTLGERLLTQLRVVVFYLSLLIYPLPSRLNLIHDFSISHSLFDPLTTLLSLLFLSALLGLAIVLAKRQKIISFCILWFFIHLAIESSFIGLELVFEHRLYLPMFGFTILTSFMLFQFISVRLTTLVACSVLIIGLLGYWTYSRNKIWEDEIVLWSDVVNKNPSSHRAQLNLGNALKQTGRIDEAIEHYRKALSINPYYSKAHNNLGMVLKSRGNLRGAMTHYYDAIKYEPANAKAHYNLGIALAEQGYIEESITHYEKALEIDPNYTKAHYNLGNVFARQEKLDQAIYHYQKAIEQEPDSSNGYNNLGIVLAHQGNIEAAIRQFNNAISINKQYVNAYVNLGKAQILKGDMTTACQNFSKALQLKPDFPLARKNFALHCNSGK